MTGEALKIDPARVSLLWASPERAPAIAELHALLFEEAWSIDCIARMLEHPGATALVAQGGTPPRALGFVIGRIAADEAEILTLAVAPWAQRRGIGRRMVEGLVRAVKRAEARRLHLEVAADNAAARALYHKLGFAEVGRRKGYYLRKGRSPADALVLALDL
ncbi:MAG: ribosomal protein S18-alanine N-acetyltransferase [Pseudomonadota bacterium]